MKFKSLFLIFSLSIFVTCSFKEPAYHLTQKEAEDRFYQLENIKYDLDIHLTTNKSFKGNLNLSFDSKKSKNIRLDYYKGIIHSSILNGENITSEIIYKDGVIILPESLIQIGPNNLVLEFETDYSKTGNGLHKFTDPDDKEIYLYSQFEAYHANKMFPCFDQPDLKAEFTLKTTAPKHWTVVSSTLPTSITASTNHPGESVTVFPKSAKISTYVFSLHAGPYQVWNDTYESIPLRLFVRKSLAKFIDPKDWFQFTKDGFAFFNSYFG
ncbi:aminopeptidase N, partial [Leptospira sp. 96542]|nr:aminopeptidase N [Leptospira sp. 96542]